MPTREPRQQTSKQCRIFKGKEQRYDPIPAVGDLQRRLETCEGLAAGFKLVPRLEQLQRVRAILGVVEDDIVSLDELQGIVQRLGLGSRQPGRNLDDLKMMTKTDCGDCFERRPVVGLAYQLDLQLAAWPLYFR